ncbi:MAG: hypothetical protein K2X31_11420 [Sphingopyxis sp.]|nr:hypothetical protein [Sphingopyxis sp.]
MNAMSASAPRDTHREEFARALTRFTRALCAGEDVRRPSEAAAALKETLAAAPWSHDERNWSAAGTRIAAYRALVKTFLGHSAARAASPSRGHGRQGAPHSFAQRRPATEASRALAALARLEPVERSALLLVAVERLSHAEAARALDLPEDELVAALARAREAFAALLAASGAAGKPHLRLVT